jgi:hydroxyacyl-ACP dehydratase HTD2-like protein with hotdog domain
MGEEKCKERCKLAYSNTLMNLAKVINELGIPKENIIQVFKQDEGYCLMYYM